MIENNTIRDPSSMSSVLMKPYHNILCPHLDATCGQTPIHPILARSSSVTGTCARYAQAETAEDGISDGVRSNMDASPHRVEVVNSWLTHALIWSVIAATRAVSVGPAASATRIDSRL
jgi:hypothetical protein